MIKKFSVNKAIKNLDGVALFADPTASTNYKQGDVVPIQILKFANRNHPMYWKILIDQKYFSNVIRNFENNITKDELPVNMEHDRTKAQGWYKRLYQEGDCLFADVELTNDGAANLNGKHYKYFSIEVQDKYQDKDTNQRFDNVLVGGAFTNYPYFNGMEKIVASDPSEKESDNNLLSTTKNPMLKELLAKFSAQESLTFAEKMELAKVFHEATEEEKTENEATVEATLNKFTDPEKLEMAKELAQLKEGQRFSEVTAQFSDIKAFNMEGEEEKALAQNVLKSFANLSNDEIANIQKVFASYQAVVDTLTDHQLSKSFAKKEEDMADKKEETTTAGKKKISEAAFTKKCEAYAVDKNINVNDAYENLKDGYEITKDGK